LRADWNKNFAAHANQKKKQRLPKGIVWENVSLLAMGGGYGWSRKEKRGSRHFSIRHPRIESERYLLERELHEREIISRSRERGLSTLLWRRRKNNVIPFK